MTMMIITDDIFSWALVAGGFLQFFAAPESPEQLRSSSGDSGVTNFRKQLIRDVLGHFVY